MLDSASSWLAGHAYSSRESTDICKWISFCYFILCGICNVAQVTAFVYKIVVWIVQIVVRLSIAGLSQSTSTIYVGVVCLVSVWCYECCFGSYIIIAWDVVAVYRCVMRYCGMRLFVLYFSCIMCIFVQNIVKSRYLCARNDKESHRMRHNM